MKYRDSKDEYELTWAKLMRWVEESASRGSSDPASIVREITDKENREFLTSRPFLAYGNKAGSDCRVAVNRGAYELRADDTAATKIIDVLVEFLTDNLDQIDAVVEMGAGTGRNLFLLMDRLGPKRRRGIQFHGCEYTQAGRTVCQRLCELGNIDDLAIHPFDYRKPRLPFLDGTPRVLFFSVHSVEQVTFLPDELLTEMLRSTAACTCFHFEPVGWQMDPELVRWRQRRDSLWMRARELPFALAWKGKRTIDNLFGTNLAKGFRSIDPRDVQIGDATKTSMNAAKWSAQQRYNLNLIEVLRTAERAGKIEIARLEPNWFGVNPFNPTAVICWRGQDRSQPDLRPT